MTDRTYGWHLSANDEPLGFIPVADINPFLSLAVTAIKNKRWVHARATWQSDARLYGTRGSWLVSSDTEIKWRDEE